MKQALTAAQLALLDTHPQRVEFYAAFHKPRIVAHGTLSAIPNNYPGSQVLIYNLTNGLNLTDIQAGMTLRIGSESQKDDYGTLRVREDYSSGSIIKTAVFGSGLVNFVTGACLTVMEDYRVWPIHHEYDTALSAWLVDTKNYTSQLSLYGPQAIMGPPAVATLDGGKAVVSYVGNLSYSHSAGASITSQAWAFPNGQTVSSALGSSAAPVNITYINASPTGRYHSLTVTDGNGTSHISKRLTFAFSSHIDHQPARVSFESITGGLKAGGYRTRVTVLDNAPSGLVNDGGVVVIFERASYGTAGSSVGGNYYGRDNIVLVGRVVGESLRIEPFTNQLSFALETIDGEMRRTNAYDLFLEGSSAASSWDMASNLTLDHAALALVKHRSTISAVTDFHPASGAAATNEIYYRALPAGTLWDQLTYNYAAAFGLVAADMQGTIWAGLDAQVTGLSANLPNVMAITKERRMDSTTVEHEHHDTNAQYRLYAIQGGTASPLGAESPGQRQGYYGGKQEITRNLLVNDQDTLITWSGNVRARENNPYKRVITGMAGNYRLDSVPQSRVTMSLSAANTKNRLHWDNKVFIPTETTLNYNNAGMYATAEVSLEASVNGTGGSAITFPTVTNTGGGGGPVGTPPTPTTPGTEASGDLVYVVTTSKIARTRNFKSASPTYTDITGSATGTFTAFILDPFDPNNGAYLLSTTTLYRCEDLDSATPTWTSILTAAAVQTAKSWANVTFAHMCAPITQAGGLCVGGRSTSSSGLVFGSVTDDYGTGWTHTSLATSLSGDSADYGVRRVIADLLTPDKYFIVQGPSNRAATIFATTDGGATWNTFYTFGAFQRLYCFDFGYSTTPALIEKYWYVQRNMHELYASDDFGSSFSEVKDTGLSPAPEYGRISLNAATSDQQDIMWADPRENVGLDQSVHIFRSYDGGATWPVDIDTNLHFIEALGRWPYDPDRVFLLGSSDIYYSTDGAVTLNGRTGNWTTVFGSAFANPVMIVPVWINP